jgi:hypothetical protein
MPEDTPIKEISCTGNSIIKGKVRIPGISSTGPNIDIGMGAGNKVKAAKNTKIQRFVL